MQDIILKIVSCIRDRRYYLIFYLQDTYFNILFRDTLPRYILTSTISSNQHTVVFRVRLFANPRLKCLTVLLTESLTRHFTKTVKRHITYLFDT